MGFFDKDNVSSLNVMFKKSDEVKAFVFKVSKFKESINLSDNENCVCNGKSILGILGMDLTKPVKVTCNSLEFDELNFICDSLGIIIHPKIEEGNDS